MKSLLLSTLRAQFTSKGLDAFKVLALDGKDRLVLGCGPSCDLTINDGTLSARHLIRKRAGPGWTVEDAGSSTGTRLQAKVPKPHEAHPLMEGARTEAAQVTLSSWNPEGPWRRLSAL